MTADEHDTTFLKWPNIKRLKVELVYDFIFYFMEVLRNTLKETLYTWQILTFASWKTLHKLSELF